MHYYYALLALFIGTSYSIYSSTLFCPLLTAHKEINLPCIFFSGLAGGIRWGGVGVRETGVRVHSARKVRVRVGVRV